MHQLSQQDDHKMAAVQATRFLLEDQPDAAAHRGASLPMPGLVVNIVSREPPQIELAASHVVPSESTRED
jgi:hypothetical protein